MRCFFPSAFRRFILIQSVTLALAGVAFAQDTQPASQPPVSVQAEYDQAALLRRMIDLDRLYMPPAPGERAVLYSSWDRAQREVRNGRYVNWDANEDRNNYVRTTADGWNVWADIQGPGVVNRIWCDAPVGELRIFIDGTKVIESELVGIFDGLVAPFGTPFSYQFGDGAGTSYFPIGFAKRCQIMTKRFTGEYHVDATRFPATTRVQPFRPELTRAALEALEEVTKIWNLGLPSERLLGDRRTGTYAYQLDLKQGEKLIETVGKPGTIRQLFVSLTDPREPRERYALHNLILRIYFDDATTPAVEAPLTSFFGAGFTRQSYRSLTMGTALRTNMPVQHDNEAWQFYCFFPMPFHKNARIEIENANTREPVPIGVLLYMRVEMGTPPKDALQFKARMHVEEPAKSFDFPVLYTTGRGRVVGNVLHVDVPRSGWWGTGDHKAWIDADRFPSILGTSTQGWVGNIERLWYFRGVMHGATLVNEFGKNSCYRWLIPDALTFQKGIRLTLENWQPPGADDIYFSTVAYWYGEPNAETRFEALDRDALDVPGKRIPGSVEVEGYVIGNGWGNEVPQRHAGGVEFSNERAVRILKDKTVEIDIPHDEPGLYRLYLRTDPSRTFERIVVRDAEDKLIGTVIWGRDVKESIYEVGTIQLKDGRTRVRVEVDFPVTLDCWIVRGLTAE